MDLGAIMRAMGELEAETRQVRAAGEAGGGLVRVTVDGQREVQSVEIDPSLWSGRDDRELAEELVRAATNAAGQRAQAAMRERQGELLRRVGLDPSLLGMLGSLAR